MFLQHAQQFDLQMLGVVELISSRKIVPVCAASKRPVRLPDRAGERAADVAEQLAFQQAFAQCPAVDADERARLRGAQAMDGRGDQFLARSGFAEQQDRGVAAATWRVSR